MANTKEGERPVGWGEYKRRAPHPLAAPLVASEWMAEWGAYLLSRWAFLRMLDYLGRLSVLVVVIFYFAESGEREQARHYQAWQVINTAQGKGGNGGRIDALAQLNSDGMPLVGVDVDGAFLQGVKLRGASLSRCHMNKVDGRGADLREADMEWAEMNFANFREADLRGAKLGHAELKDADLTDAKLGGADFAGAEMERVDLRNADLDGAKGLMENADWTGANVTGVKNARKGFVEWAVKHGAVGG
jgi:hypothetical protein